MKDNFTFLDLLHYAWSHAGKYIGISICTVLVYVIGLFIIGNFFVVSDEAFASLPLALIVTNCTGYLAGKLNRILRLLEAQEPADDN